MPNDLLERLKALVEEWRHDAEQWRIDAEPIVDPDIRHLRQAHASRREKDADQLAAVLAESEEKHGPRLRCPDCKTTLPGSEAGGYDKPTDWDRCPACACSFAFIKPILVESESDPHAAHGPECCWRCADDEVRREREAALSLGHEAVERAMRDRPKAAAIIRGLQLNQLRPAPPLPDGEPLPIRQESDLGPAE